MIQLARQNSMSAAVPRQEGNLPPSQRARQYLIRRGAERGPDLDPFLTCKPFDMIKATAADNADTIPIL